jgi:hypothetical protein
VNPATHTTTSHHHTHTAPAAYPSLLPGSGTLGGWLIFLAGLAMLIAVVLIPASVDLADARQSRDQAHARERHGQARLVRYETYLTALQQHDETLLRSLAMSELNMAPADRLTLLPPRGPGDLDLFGPLEPTPVSMTTRQRPRSVLETLATDRRQRLWLIAGAMLCLFIGLLPATE